MCGLQSVGSFAVCVCVYQFENTFLENLKRRHGTKRMRATVVYNEYIADKLHVHMNATQWTTLGTFVQYLGRTGKCSVDETEKVGLLPLQCSIERQSIYRHRRLRMRV